MQKNNKWISIGTVLGDTNIDTFHFSLKNYKAKKGDIVTFDPGSIHSSYTKDGCLVLVFMRTRNTAINK